MTPEETVYFAPMPALLPLYKALKNRMEQAYSDMTVKVGKTQISFSNRCVFLVVSLPYRRAKGWPKQFLLLTFGLPYRHDSPRIALATEPYPNRWTHHVLIESEADIDGPLLALIDESYHFSMFK